MKKILYIVTQSEWGGAQKNVHDLALSLRDKHQILVAVGADGDKSFISRLKENGINFVVLKNLRRSAANPLVDLKAIWQIIKLIKREKPDIVHLHSSKAGFSGSLAAKICGVKAVYTVHGAVFEAPFSYAAKKFYLWLEKFSARYKDKIICVSENDKKLWLKYKVAPAEKLIVIHNGIDINSDILAKEDAREDLFSASAPLFEAAQKSSADLKIVGTITNLYPEKGLAYFIQAAKIVCQKIPNNLIFAVMGEGREREFLQKIIEGNGLQKKFILAGRIENAARLLKAVDVFVLPSVKEGFPYAILEAMKAGLPIVASYVGGIPEAIKNEANGFLVLPKNPERLAEKILELIQNPELASRFIKNSFGRLAEFSLEKMSSETEKVYNGL